MLNFDDTNDVVIMNSVFRQNWYPIAAKNAKNITLSNNTFEENYSSSRPLIWIEKCDHLYLSVKRTKFLRNRGTCLQLSNSAAHTEFEELELIENYSELSVGHNTGITFSGVTAVAVDSNNDVSPHTFTNCTFLRNKYESKPGASLSFYKSANLEVLIQNCYFEGNMFGL